MQDNISIQRIRLLHPKVRQEAMRLFEQANEALTGRAQIRIVQGYRTFQEQAELYAKGRSAKGPKVTNAAAGQSFHNYGLALDFALLIDGKEISWDTAKDWDRDGVADWMEAVRIFVAAGWRWGADWDGDGKTKAEGDKDEGLVDSPHLEKTFGRSWRELLVLHNSRKLDPSGYVQF